MNKFARLVVAFVALVACGFASYRLFLARTEAIEKRKVLADERRTPAATFRLPDLDGRLVGLEDFRGKVVVLDFWATWCGPCLSELEELKVAYEKYRAHPKVVFVTVNVDPDQEVVRPHVRQHGYPFTVLLGDGTVVGPYDTARIPKLYVVDGAGNIRFKVAGFERGADNVKALGWMIEAAMRE